MSTGKHFSAIIEPQEVTAQGRDLLLVDFVGRAKAIGPTLVDQQQEVEKRSFYSEDTHEMFIEAGFYKMLVPRRYGGHEVDLGTFFRVIVEISAGCASTGWQLALGATHALTVASFFPEDAQRALFGDGHFIAASVARPAMSAQRADGGWMLNGTVGYASGIPYSTHFVGYTMRPAEDGAPAGVMTYVAPRNAWRRLDDWGDTLGLRGSGSHSVCFENGFVPDLFVLQTNMLSDPVAGGTVGSRLHGNPMYAGKVLSSYAFEGAAVKLGMLRGAIEVYRELLESKMTSTPPVTRRAENADFQRFYGLLLWKYAAAEALLRQGCDDYMEACHRNVNEGVAFDDAEDMRLAGITDQIAQIAWQAMEGIILPTAGPAEFRQGKRLERIFRDMAMSRSHLGSLISETVLPRGFASMNLAIGGNTGIRT
jgi:3-hydroxy-9,10-secoandrosta-1,3,5(10)-triene-9,17-dione monooxygenase